LVVPGENEMTADDLAALEAEIARLEGDARAAIADDIRAARSLGDLKENAEYHDAKERQAHLETKILRLRDQRANAVVVSAVSEAGPAGVVSFGSRVRVVDESSGRESEYTLVAALEADAAAGKLSVDSPVARALRGRRAGDVASVETPRGARSLRILSVA
jgi:transcription elongation factor GreA